MQVGACSLEGMTLGGVRVTDRIAAHEEQVTDGKCVVTGGASSWRVQHTVIQHRIPPAERLFVLRYPGPSSVSGWKEVISTCVAAHPEFVTCDGLVDIRSMETCFSAGKMKVHARDDKEPGFQDHKRRTAVMVGRTAHRGSSRMFEIPTEPERVVERLTTRSIPEAAWRGGPRPRPHGSGRNVTSG